MAQIVDQLVVGQPLLAQAALQGPYAHPGGRGHLGDARHAAAQGVQDLPPDPLDQVRIGAAPRQLLLQEALQDPQQPAVGAGDHDVEHLLLEDHGVHGLAEANLGTEDLAVRPVVPRRRMLEEHLLRRPILAKDQAHAAAHPRQRHLGVLSAQGHRSGREAVAQPRLTVLELQDHAAVVAHDAEIAAHIQQSGTDGGRIESDKTKGAVVPGVVAGTETQAQAVVVAALGRVIEQVEVGMQGNGGVRVAQFGRLQPDRPEDLVGIATRAPQSLRQPDDGRDLNERLRAGRHRLPLMPTAAAPGHPASNRVRPGDDASS